MKQEVLASFFHSEDTLLGKTVQFICSLSLLHNFRDGIGLYTLDDETKKQLKARSVEVEERTFLGHRHTFIRFNPNEPNLETIKEQWSKVTALLPDKGQSAQPSSNDGAIRFRKKYAPQSPYLEEWQERIIFPDGNTLQSPPQGK